VEMPHAAVEEVERESWGVGVTVAAAAVVVSARRSNATGRGLLASRAPTAAACSAGTQTALHSSRLSTLQAGDDDGALQFYVNVCA
jgi:hypothetical protein